jgi:intein/homing endonuclease
MVTMRILIKNKSQVFNEFFEKTDLTRKQLSLKIGVNIWTLKHWLGDCTIPEKHFIKLIKIYPQIKNIAVYKKLPENWGASKGGKISFSKKSRKEIIKQAEIARRGLNYKFKIPSLNEDFCEFYGILLGDGCIFRFFVKSENRVRYSTSISGNSIDDLDYFKNNLIPLTNRLFGLSPSINYSGSCNGIRIDIRNRTMANIFLKLGFPLGKKKEICIPSKILNSNNKNVNRLLRGLFDTDGCFFARKDEDYKYPYIAITSYSKTLRKQLKEILTEQGFPAYIHSNDVLIRGIANTKKWFKIIGSSNPLTLKRFKNFEETDILLPKYLGR